MSASATNPVQGQKWVTIQALSPLCCTASIVLYSHLVFALWTLHIDDGSCAWQRHAPITVCPSAVDSLFRHNDASTVTHNQLMPVLSVFQAWLVVGSGILKD